METAKLRLQQATAAYEAAKSAEDIAAKTETSFSTRSAEFVKPKGLQERKRRRILPRTLADASREQAIRALRQRSNERRHFTSGFAASFLIYAFEGGPATARATLAARATFASELETGGSIS